jgi:hypothetical protein
LFFFLVYRDLCGPSSLICCRRSTSDFVALYLERDRACINNTGSDCGVPPVALEYIDGASTRGEDSVWNVSG